MRRRDLRLVPLALLSFAIAGSVSAAETVDFNRDIRPLLSRNCYACHGPDAEHREAGLRLDTHEGAIAELESGVAAVRPGKPDESELLARITSEDESLRMPPVDSGHTLSTSEVELIRKWVVDGAEYAVHWSFVPPKRAELPAVQDPAWAKNPIDRFVQSRLEAEKFALAPEADRYTLLRRVSLDLTGLPPTSEEVAAFIADTSPDAYEKAVDRLLASPAYGERWARMWLDLARYADSAGYGSDPLRTIWRYRDWVIGAMNQNMPYDQFTREQLAGDLLPGATLEQRMATAFHRNTMTNTEGGTDDEEFRVAAVKDRVDTTVQVWMGLTMGCAQCHTHKYDPISQHDYYSMFAIFNQTADADRGDESPLLQVPTADIEQHNHKIEEQIAALRTQLETPTAQLAQEQAAWEASLQHKADWQTLRFAALASQEGAQLEELEDGAVLASGNRAANDTYTLTARTSLQGITALRLETIPDPSFAAGGAGRADDGNFVLSRFAATAADAARVGQPPLGRIVRIELPGTQKMLALAEVQVFSGQDNLARAGQATQSSVDYEGPPELAIDGNTDGHYFNAKSTTHTAISDNPWWEVDLGAAKPVERIAIWNRTDGNVGVRLAGFRVSVLDAERNVLWQQDIAEPPSPSLELSVGGPRSIQFRTALADHSQPDFHVVSAISQPNLTLSGWAIGPHISAPHAATFVAAEPVGGAAETELVITLDHRFNAPGFLLGKFRLSATTNPQATERAAVPAEVLAIVDTPADQRTPEQIGQLAAHYRGIAPSLAAMRDQIATLEKSRMAAPTLPVMQELPPEQRRVTHLLPKGNFLEKGEQVEAALPHAFHSLPEGAELNRLGVASWLTDPANPLTARVAVNRFWAQLFGMGLVETEEDFGSQGELPTHPQLLDYLAVDLMDSGWDIKRMLRQIVTSQTYRQSSVVTPDALERDPRNRLFTRGPSFRLEAEMVRDQALSISGLLSHKMGGPSVFPPQPPNLWQAAFNGERTWATSTGEDRYRRGLYTFWRRTVPYPSMATFDAPSREICTVRRIRTNTPLQAFVTMNDPVFVEASQAFARRMVREGGATPAERAAYGLRLALARPAEQAQIDAVVRLFESERAHYLTDNAAATQLATDPLGPLPEGYDAAELAAWTVLGNVLLNMDGVLTKR